MYISIFLSFFITSPLRRVPNQQSDHMTTLTLKRHPRSKNSSWKGWKRSSATGTLTMTRNTCNIARGLFPSLPSTIHGDEISNIITRVPPIERCHFPYHYHLLSIFSLVFLASCKCYFENKGDNEREAKTRRSCKDGKPQLAFHSFLSLAWYVGCKRKSCLAGFPWRKT